MEIPETVWNTAVLAMASSDVSTEFYDDYQTLTEVVARAILAERERCATIAYEYGDDWTAACEISQAIRNK